MKQGSDHSIVRIRTFGDDVAYARGNNPKPQKAKPSVKKKTAQDIADAILKTKQGNKQIPDSGLKDAHSTQTHNVQTVNTKIHIETTKKQPAQNIQFKKQKEPLIKSSLEQKSKETKQVKKQTTLKDSSTHKKQQQSHIAKQASFSSANNSLEEGTIITNKRKKKYRLIPSIAEAIRSWFTIKKKKITEKKEPEHVVEKAETRIETITAAARVSNYAPHDDHGIVIKRLTKNKREKHAPKVLIKKKEEVVAPVWSSALENNKKEIHQDNSTIDLPKNQSENLSEEKGYGSKKEERTAIHHSIPSKPKIPVTPATKESKIKTAPTAPTREHSITQKKTSKEKLFKTNTVQNAQPPVSQKRPTQTAKRSRSRVSIYLYILVVITASLLGITATVYWFKSSTPEQEAVVIHIPSLFKASMKIPVLIEPHERLMNALSENAFSQRETALLYPAISTQNGVPIPADTQQILNTLQLNAPGQFTRNISQINFGSYEGVTPFVVLKVKNFDIAFSGLLKWEKSMSADLSPLFGSVVLQSYNPQATEGDRVRSAFFRDTLAANKSIRLLVDETNEEKLLYGFVTPNIVLITTNSTAFENILPLVLQ